MKVAIKDIHRLVALSQQLGKIDKGSSVFVEKCPGGAILAVFTVDDNWLTMKVAASKAVTGKVPWVVIQQLGKRKAGEVDLSSLIEKSKVQLSTVPKSTKTNPITMLDALEGAAECVMLPDDAYLDKNKCLTSICLNGKNSQIIATDGMKLFLQEGFKFPFRKDVLIPASKIFRSKDLRECGDTLSIGVVNNGVCFTVGDVSFFLGQTGDKYRDVLALTVAWDIPERTLQLDKEDAAFVLAQIDKLPHEESSYNPVIIDLENKKARLLFGYSAVQPDLTSVLLARSTYTGKERIRAVVNRQYVKRAITHGLTKFVVGDGKWQEAIACIGDKKKYIFMPIAGSWLEKFADAAVLKELSSDGLLPGAKSIRRKK